MSGGFYSSGEIKIQTPLVPYSPRKWNGGPIIISFLIRALVGRTTVFLPIGREASEMLFGALSRAVRLAPSVQARSVAIIGVAVGTVAGVRARCAPRVEIDQLNQAYADGHIPRACDYLDYKLDY